MQVTIIPIVIGAFGTVTKGLLKGLEDLEVGGRVKTIQTITLLRTARILRVLETWGDLLSLRLQWKTISVSWCEKLKWVNNNNNNKTWTWLRKGNFKRETESLLMAAQNSAIRTNHIKARIDKTQQNSKCRLCGDRDETINHIISECSKLAQKEYKARHDWVGKVIHWKISKKFKFDHATKWYKQSQAPVLENDTHKLLWDFDI